MKRVLTEKELEVVKEKRICLITFPTKEITVSLCYLEAVLLRLLRLYEGDLSIPFEIFSEFLGYSVPTVSRHIYKLAELGKIKIYKKGMPPRIYIVNPYSENLEEEVTNESN